jgi:hypothetical protein
VSALLQILILAAGVGGAPGGISIVRAELGKDGTLQVWCSFSLARVQRVYSWRGSLQPSVGRISFLDVIDERDRELPVERVGGYEPGFPDPHDVVQGMEVAFKEPVRVVASRRASKLAGCLRVRVRYDATLLPKGVLERAGLDPIRASSDLVRVCGL